MTESQKAAPKTRKKPEGPRSHVLTDTDGKSFLVRLADVRVANNDDLDAALDGKLERGQIVKKAG